MAHSSESEVIVSWSSMRNNWIRSAFEISDATGRNVKTFFNTFVASNPGYSFTITQLYDELYQICITTDQSLKIKHKLEDRFKIALPNLRRQELFPGAKKSNRSFRNIQEFRSFNEKSLAALNKPIITRKHEEARQHDSKVRRAFNSQDPKYFLAFDIEVYEHDFSKALEIGYVIVRISPARQGTLPNLEVTSKKHLIIQENLHFKNKDRVPDNRDGFRFGVSQTLPIADAVKRFREDIRGCDYILGHSVKNDDSYLRDMGVDLSVLGKEIFDTQVLDVYKESLKLSEKYFMRSLSHLLREYKVNYQERDLHNAGCDAFYTMMVFLRLMGYSAEQVNAVIAS